jgi:hypothetical protein
LALLTALENIDDTTTLVDKTDYGPFPNLESFHGPPIHEYLRLGPGLSVSLLFSPSYSVA